MVLPGLKLGVADGIGEITFNRPERANAIDLDWLPALRGFVEAAATRPDVRCVLVAAAGRHFQAGGDLTLDITRPVSELIGFTSDAMTSWNAVLVALNALPKPVVAAVQGGTVGASVALVAACDLVIAADDAFFVVAQTRIGASLDGLPSYFLPRKIGLARAMEWTLLGDRIPAETAREAGLVNRVVPRDRLAQSAKTLCLRLAQSATVAIGQSKQLLQISLNHTIQEQAAREMQAYAITVATRDWREGIRAFMEKRPAVFEGR